MSRSGRQQRSSLVARRGVPWMLALVVAGCGARACGDIGGLGRQPRPRPHRRSDVFTDKRVMRPPIPGTVALEAPEGSPEVLTGLDSTGHPLQQIPVPVDRPLVESGRHAFEIYCAACHGLLGDGDCAVARKMASRPPPSLQTLDEHPFPPGRIFEIISKGYGVMPDYAAEIPVRERWGVVAYLQALVHSQHAPLSRAPPAIRRELEGGGP